MSIAKLRGSQKETSRNGSRFSQNRYSPFLVLYEVFRMCQAFASGTGRLMILELPLPHRKEKLQSSLVGPVGPRGGEVVLLQYRSMIVSAPRD